MKDAIKDVDARIWKRGQDKPGRRCLSGAVALDLMLTTRDHCPYFGDPNLAACALDRALDEEETLAVCVLPDRVCWLLDSWIGLEAMASFLCQTQEYAEIYGAPEGRVWQRGFWYRPIGAGARVGTRADELVQLPVEEGLVTRFGEWPAGVRSVASIHQKR